jgi:hypothetical protein
LQAYFKYTLQGGSYQGHHLCWPLFALIDFSGWRLIACSVLPIHKNSLKYGSDGTPASFSFPTNIVLIRHKDGGVTVLNEDPVLAGLMNDAGRLFNLKANFSSICLNVSHNEFGLPFTYI